MKTPLIVMGDLNSRWSTKDSAVHRLARMLSLQAYKPDKGGLATFRANRPHRRIDWILISRELAFDRYHVWPDKVSDHLGVAADLRWRR